MTNGKKIAIGVAALVLSLPVLAAGGMVAMMGPNNAIGILMYGYPQMDEGQLQVGSKMPVVALTDPDGKPLSMDGLGQDRPLVLIFGSYT